MMECKKALENKRKHGRSGRILKERDKAKADKKAGRIAAEKVL